MKKRLLLLLAATALLLLLFVPDIRRPDDRFFAAAEDTLHFPLFLVITILVLRSRSNSVHPRIWAFRVTGSLILAAAAVEVIQPFLGRTGQWTDAALGVCGVLAGVALDESSRAEWAARRIAFVGTAMACGLLAMGPLGGTMLDRHRARQDFPRLASFESWLELGRWEVAGCDVRRVRSFATHGKYALEVQVSGHDAYPGLFLTDLPVSWAGEAHLCVEVQLPSSNSLVLWMRADDRPNPAYADRYQQAFELLPGSNRICVALNDFRTPAGRILAPAGIKTWGLFLENAPSGARFYVDDVVLNGP